MPVADTAKCYISNGILSLFDTPSLVQCVSRSDTGRAYIPGAPIPPEFTFGGPVLPRTLNNVYLTLFRDSDCSDVYDYIGCTNFGLSTCTSDSKKNPILLNVGPPFQVRFFLDAMQQTVLRF